MLNQPSLDCGSSGLDGLFYPSRIAVVGASDRPDSAGSVIWKNLSGFTGDVLPVSSSRSRLDNTTAYRSILDIEEPIDLAVVAVPAHAVPSVVAEAGRRGARACIVISSGFAETGEEGAVLQHRVKQAAANAGVRIIGPNCYGVQNSANRLNASIAPAGPDRAGTISLVTQSGAYGMALHTLAKDEQLTFDKVVATGNKMDVTDAELLANLASQQGTGPICFFLESLPDGRDFFDIARDVTPHRPVIVCRTGRSTSGRRAARSHTASLAGASRVWSAAFNQAGIIETRSGLEMLDVARILEKQRPPRGDRVGIITNSGGVGVELTDLLATEGLRVPHLSEAVRHGLADFLPPHGSVHNPVDVTTAWRRFPELYGRAIHELAHSGEVDSIVAVLLQRSAALTVTESVADTVERLREEGIHVPIVVCWIAGHDSHDAADPMRASGIPVLAWPQRTARALGYATRYGMRSESGSPPPSDVRPGAGDRTAAGSAMTRENGSWLGADEAARLLCEHKIPLARWDLVPGAEDVIEHAAGYRRPVVLKVEHPALLHKTDADGVVLGLHTDQEMLDAARRLISLREGASLLIQEQETGTEVIVGGLRDAEFGPVVMVGLGGIHAETTDDVQLALAPLTRAEATAMIHHLRGSAVLRGSRIAPVNIDSIAAVITALGDLLVARSDIAEVDLNPVLARTSDCVVVDWRIRCTSSS